MTSNGTLTATLSNDDKHVVVDSKPHQNPAVRRQRSDTFSEEESTTRMINKIEKCREGESDAVQTLFTENGPTGTQRRASADTGQSSTSPRRGSDDSGRSGGVTRSRSQDALGSGAKSGMDDSFIRDGSDLEDQCASLSEYDQPSSSGPPSSSGGMIRSGTYDVLCHIPLESPLPRVPSKELTPSTETTTAGSNPPTTDVKNSVGRRRHGSASKNYQTNSKIHVIKEAPTESSSSSPNSVTPSSAATAEHKRATPPKGNPKNVSQKDSNGTQDSVQTSRNNGAISSATTSRSRPPSHATNTTKAASATQNSSRLSTSSDRASEENADSGSLFQYFVDVDASASARDRGGHGDSSLEFASLTPSAGTCDSSNPHNVTTSTPRSSTSSSSTNNTVKGHRRPPWRGPNERCISSNSTENTRSPPPHHRNNRGEKTSSPLTTSASGGFMFFGFDEDTPSTAGSRAPPKKPSPTPHRPKARQQIKKVGDCMMTRSFDSGNHSTSLTATGGGDPPAAPSPTASSTASTTATSASRPSTRRGPRKWSTNSIPSKRNSIDSASRCDSRERFYTVMDTDRVVVVTVSPSGIGEAAVLSFVREWDPHLVITGRNLDLITSLAIKVSQLSHSRKKPLTVVGDLTSHYYAERLISETILKFGRLDVLVNASTLYNPPAASLSCAGGVHEDPKFQENLEANLKTNVMSLIRLTRLAIPHLIATQGVVVNVSFLPPREPASLHMIYSMSKCMIDTFTRCLSGDLAAKGVRVNTINPGPIDATATCTVFSNGTVLDMTANKRPTKSASSTAATTAAPVTSSLNSSQAQDVANLILFIAAERTSYLSGQTIALNQVV